jgi:ribosomal protein L32
MKRSESKRMSKAARDKRRLEEQVTKATEAREAKKTSPYEDLHEVTREEVGRGHPWW